MHDNEDLQHFADVATWLDAVRASLGVDVEVVTVGLCDTTSASTVKIRPDRAGIAASIALVRLVEPRVALLFPPADDDTDFRIVLVGEREVEIVCGPPLPPREDWGDPVIDKALRDRIDEGLLDIVEVIKSE